MPFPTKNRPAMDPNRPASELRPSVHILLPAYKSGDLLEKVFWPSYLKHGYTEDMYGKHPCNLLIYDNGGNGPFLDSLKGKPNVFIFGDGQNVGLNKAYNIMSNYVFEKIEPDKFMQWLYLPHTDMYLMPGWTNALVAQSKRAFGVAHLLCSRSIEPVQGHTPFHFIANYGQVADEFQELRLLQDYAEYCEQGIVTGYRMPFFVPFKLWKMMRHFNKTEGVCDGAFDENLFSYATDDDLFLTAYYIGCRRFWLCNNSLVYHLQGKSNNQQSKDKDREEPYEYLRDKWSQFSFSMKGPLDQILQRLIPWNVKVA